MILAVYLKNKSKLNIFIPLNKDSCQSNDYFYCHKSRTCVPKSFRCDGSVNCFHGEDEDIEECKSTFSDGATLECQEDYRPGFNITIYAVPCDGIIGEWI